MEKPTTGLRKRQQIGRANRMMLLWIIAVSVIVGIAVVLAVFLVQKIWYQEKVLNEKAKTVKVLQDNYKAVTDDNGLKNEISKLNTNEALRSTRLNDDASALQSVLDALPADANSTALASSLQTKLLTGINGIKLESIAVDQTDSTDGSGTTSAAGSSSAASADQIGFSFSVSTEGKNDTALRQVLENLEKSIRPFNVGTISIEAQGTRVIMTVKGVSYYEPATTVQPVKKVVKP